MNARGIPTAAYQVFLVLHEVGTPPPSQVWRGGGPWGRVPPGRIPPGRVPPSQVWWRVPEVGYPLAGYTPQQGTPCQVQWGIPKVGYPPTRGTPQPGLMGDTPQAGYLLQGLMGGTQGGGSPPPAGVPPSTWTWLGYPSPSVDRQNDGWMDGQTRVKTLPYRSYYVRGR